MADQLPQPGGGQRSQTKFIVFEGFDKLNTQSIRQSLSEKELAWLENLQPIAPNNLTTVPAPAASPLATISENISLMFYADISGTDYFICFTTAGAAYAVNIATGGINNFAPDGTFSSAPDVTTWEASRILIADSKAGYATWDGTLFINTGNVSPNITVTDGGSGYSPSSPPSVTISGGSGTGATAVATVDSLGEVVAVTLTNPGHGYQPGDTLTVTFGTSPGSGAAGHVTMTGSSVTQILFSSIGQISSPGVGNHSLTFVGGGGMGAAGYATVTTSGAFFTISAVTLTSIGSGYTTPPRAEISTSLGTATYNTVLGTESVATIVLDSGGSLYAAAPAVSIVPPDGNGSGAAATATESGGAVTALALNASAVVTLEITTQGSFSNSAGTYALIFTGGGGSSAAGTATTTTITDPVTGSPRTVLSSVVLSSGGSGYTSAPTVTITSATGTPGTIEAFIASQGAGYDTQPAVVIGSGSGAAAIAHVWPFITSTTNPFTTVAVFQGRVWLGGGQLLTWTGTGATYGNVAYDDFLAADASGSLLVSDADLIHAITALRSLNNYLFIMGDQSVKQIGNISLNSAGDVTLFTILTLSSDQGTIYPKSCISYNRVFLFANSNGIYGVFGSSVQKLSGDMDGIWKLVDFTQVPQGALADINAIHNAVFLIRYKDPLVGTRSIMLAFDGKKWFVLDQGIGMTAIATSASLATGQNSLYGSRFGDDVTNLLADPTAEVAFKIQTALTHHGNAVQGKKVIRAGFSSALATGTGEVFMTIDTEAANGSQLGMDVPTGFALVGGSNSTDNIPITGSGIFLGLTITGNLSGYTITNLIAEYQEGPLWKP